MAKSRNSVSGPGPVKSTSYGQHTQEIHRKGTREYSLASQAVSPSRCSVNSSGVLTVTGRFNRPGPDTLFRDLDICFKTANNRPGS